MTDLTFDPAALRALLDAATPAPWRAERDGADGVIRFPDGDTTTDVWADDAAFIAAARNHMPALLDALAAAREDLAKAERQRDALARRCAVRFGETEAAREEVAGLQAESRRLGDQANHLVQQVNAACAARQRIADAHHKHVDGHGGTWGECNECGNGWPCPTYTWATTDRDPLATWDPADDDAVPAAAPQTTCGDSGIHPGWVCDLPAGHVERQHRQRVAGGVNTWEHHEAVEPGDDEPELVTHVETVSAATLAGMAAIGGISNPEVFAPWDDDVAAVPGDGEQAATTSGPQLHEPDTCPDGPACAFHRLRHVHPIDVTALPTSGQA